MTTTYRGFYERVKKLLPPKFPDNHHLVDQHQTWWQLASVQLGGGVINVPAMLVGIQLTLTYGVGSAFCSIVVGNLILYMYSLLIVLSTDHHRLNTFQLARSYFGPVGGGVIAVSLLLSGFGWFGEQIADHVSTIMLNFGMNTGNIRLTQQLGLGLSIPCIGLSMYGIRGIRSFTVWSTVPIICLFVGLAVFAGGDCELKSSESLNLTGVPLVIIAFLPGVTDFPTFFRHSQSRSHSMIALPSIFVIATGISSLGIYVCSYIQAGVEAAVFSNPAYSGLVLTILVAALLLSITGVNAANIYSASIGYEAIAPESLTGRKEYFIIGIVPLVLFFVLPKNMVTESFYRSSDLVIGTMGIVAMSSFLYSRVLRKSVRSADARWNLIAWACGSLSGIASRLGLLTMNIQPLLVALVVSLLVFLFTVAMREIVWSLIHRK